MWWLATDGPVWCARWFAGAPVWWCSIDCPVARPNAALRRVMSLLLHESGRRESKALLSGPLGIRAICPGAKLPNRGVRERLNAAAGCHAAPKGNRPFCCEYRESVPDEMASASMRVQDSEVALVGASDYRAVKLSLNSNCQKNRRKLFSSPTTPHVACNVVVNAFQQYERLARLATAKLERRRPILGLAHPPLREMPRIHWRFPIGTC